MKVNRNNEVVVGISVVTIPENEGKENLVSVFCYSTIYNLVYFENSHQTCVSKQQCFVGVTISIAPLPPDITIAAID